ncbi:hypothetical protein DPMN_071202 [Dreissena polymorpha]|uniref:Uncharacterized protein n=1 Tax=Dreissena polymorpha TaxID=45954 RepID=A0A9D3Z1V4_DREPO|nr:hypothetical protein DPMN_192982 [Dreissena polymorpha]KAH3711533.1 hypothetical protein DPMN_071202 [Dreissena polymorpha]
MFMADTCYLVQPDGSLHPRRERQSRVFRYGVGSPFMNHDLHPGVLSQGRHVLPLLYVQLQSKACINDIN